MAGPTEITFNRQAMEQLGNLFNSHTRELQNMVRDLSSRLGGMGSVGIPGGGIPGSKNGADLEDARKELNRFISILRQGRQTLSATERYNLNAAKRQRQAIEEEIKKRQENTDTTRENSDETRDNSDATGDNTKKINESTRRLSDFAEKIVGGTLKFEIMTRAVNEFSQAYKQGFNWNAMSDAVNAALQMGMSPKDMMDFQKRFRRVSNTFEGGITEFNNTVASSNVEWLHYTGSLKDAAIAQGEFYSLALSMGVGAKDMKGAVGGMFDEFKKLQVATSMTAEEFVETQKSLLAEKSVRDKLIGLQGKERINYMNKLTDTTYLFQTLGLQREAAEGVVKLIESQSSKTGVSRLREGAQLQAAAGIIGMDRDQATRVNQLRGKRNLSSSEQVELANLYAQMSERIEAKKNQGGFAEYQMDALEKTFPVLQDIANQVGGQVALAKGAEANQSTLAKQQQDLQERDSGIYGEIKENIVRFTNIFEGWSQSMLAAVLALGAGKLAFSALNGRLGGAGSGGAGGGPGGPGGPGGWRGALGTYGPRALKGLGIGAGIGILGNVIVDSSVEDKTAHGTLSGAVNGAALGASVGALFGPLGLALGTAGGGILGAITGFVTSQKDMNDQLEEQKKKTVDQTSLDESRYRMAQQQYQREIDQLKQKGQLTTEEQSRLDAIQKKMDEAKKDHDLASNKATASQFGYQMDKQSLAKDWMAQAANDMQKTGWFSTKDSDDVKAMLTELRGKLSATGVNLTDDQIKARFGDILGGIAADQADKNARNQGFDAASNFMTGANNKYDAAVVNPMIAEAMRQMSSQLSVGFAESNQATFAAKINTPEALSALQDQVKATADQLAKDQAALAATQSSAMFDDSGASSVEAAKLQKRIDMSQQTLNALQQLASKDNTVKFESETELLDTLKKLADAVEKNPIKRVKA